MVDNNKIVEKKCIDLQEVFFFLFVIIMSATKGAGYYDGQVIYKILFMIALACVACKILVTDYTYIEIILVMFFGMLVLIMNRQSGEKGPLIIYAILVGIKNMSMKQISKIGAISFGTAMTCKVLCNLIFLNKSGYMLAPKLGMSSCIRWALGYAHPNTVAIGYLALCILIVYSLDEKYTMGYLLLLNVGNILLNLYCLSYTGMLVTIGYLVVAYITAHYEFKSQMWFWIAEAVFPSCVLFSLIIPFVIPSYMADYIKIHFDSINSRLMLARQFVTVENLSAWGINVSTLTDKRFTLDNSYLYCLVFNGMIASILLLFGYLYMIHQNVKDRNQNELTAIIFLLLAGIFEPFLFNTSFKNISIFFLGISLSKFLAQLFYDKEDCCRLVKKRDALVKNEVVNVPVLSLKQLYLQFINPKTCMLMTIIDLLLAIGTVRVWQVDESFFDESVIISLRECNELYRALLLENVRRAVTIFCVALLLEIMILPVVMRWKREKD